MRIKIKKFPFNIMSCKDSNSCTYLIGVKQAVRITKDQYNLDKIERTVNVINAFKIDMLYNIRNKRILLIDDVFTTGSTVEECSKLLIGAGTSDVFVITAASGINI